MRRVIARQRASLNPAELERRDEITREELTRFRDIAQRKPIRLLDRHIKVRESFLGTPPQE